MCLTPPNTMYKVQKHIMECQNEVKSNIFHEAFSLIHDTAFHHPHDHATIEYKDENDFPHRNFTLTEQEILKFFQNHDHSGLAYEDLHTHAHAQHHTVDEDLHTHSQHHSIDDHPHVIDEHSHHTLNEHLHQSHTPQSIVHYPHANIHDWQQHPAYLGNVHKKTDAAQATDKLNEEQPSPETFTGNAAKRSPYAYFDIKTGTATTNQEQLRTRRSDSDIYSDENHHSDIHPTTASFKDKRIAGVSKKNLLQSIILHIQPKCVVPT